MKVRPKFYPQVASVVYDVSEQSEHFYIVQTRSGRNDPSDLRVVSKIEYEPIPDEPSWQDVTGECITEDATPDLWDAIKHKGKSIMVGNQFDYRLRKVRRADPWKEGESSNCLSPWAEAFIIERKVSE